ncbi:unnamed protein product [Psylliodes chrysocephalus]|uniref:Uncharacterized protein n=1 Tax=Psylliodes chrysocephalus TaxID=3402493 RepID=A0A9P0D7B0_9CUCU|nr:unnamed protein product [Psylliodes chrysocephala]
MDLINQKAAVELLGGWNEQILSARSKPGPFCVIDCKDQNSFRSWTNHFANYLYKKCPFDSRLNKELTVHTGMPRMIEYRESYNGACTTSVVIPPRRKSKNIDLLPTGQFEVPSLKYNEKLPIYLKKFQDLQELKRFCEPNESKYFENLFNNHTTEDEDA